MSFEDDSPTLVTGGTSEERPDGTTRTTRDDGSVVQTDPAGNVIYDSRTGEGGHSEAGSDTNSNAGTTDDDTSGGSDDTDDGNDDGSDGSDGTDTALTTGEGGPISPETQAALDFMGYSGVRITRAGTAGPDYGQGDPGASGDTGGGDTGGGGSSSGDGSHPEPMTTGEGGAVLVDPGTRNPTAGPDYAPGIPGDSPDGPVGTGTHEPVTGGPGMDPTVAMDAGGSGRAAATEPPALADDFSTNIMGGLAAPASAMDVASAAPVARVEEAPPSEVAPVGQVDAPAAGLDLSAHEASLEIAPAAMDAPQMEQPVLEQLDPGFAAVEPPPDAGGLDSMEGGPLP